MRGAGAMHLFAGDSVKANSTAKSVDVTQNGVDGRNENKEHVVAHDRSHDDSTNHREYIREFFRKEDCLYSHAMYMNAGKLFALLRHENENEAKSISGQKSWPQRQTTNSNGSRDVNQQMPNMEFASELQKRRTFQLVYATLKCKWIWDFFFRYFSRSI